MPYFMMILVLLAILAAPQTSTTSTCCLLSKLLSIQLPNVAVVLLHPVDWLQNYQSLKPLPSKSQSVIINNRWLQTSPMAIAVMETHPTFPTIIIVSNVTIMTL
jgi:hypothetical protein